MKTFIMAIMTLMLVMQVSSVQAHASKNHNDGAIIGFIIGAVIGAELQKQNQLPAPHAIRPRPRPKFLCNQDRYFPAYTKWSPTFNQNGKRVGYYREHIPAGYKTVTYWCE